MMQMKGVLRATSIHPYETLDLIEVKAELSKIGATCDADDDLDTPVSQLEAVHCTRYIKEWSDHSHIKDHSYYLHTVQFLWDISTYLTSSEYEEKYGTKLDVQTFVEKPNTFILSLGSAAIDDCLSFSQV